MVSDDPDLNIVPVSRRVGGPWVPFRAVVEQIFAMSQKSFLEFRGGADSLAVSFLVLAAEVLQRDESTMLHGIEFCIGAPRAESAFNRVQVVWEKRLLGFPRFGLGQWAFIVAECGWCRCLGTGMYERAIMVLTRAVLLLLSNLARTPLGVAISVDAPTYLAVVRARCASASHAALIPDILQTVGSHEYAGARRSKEARSALVKRCKRLCTKLALDESERAAYQSAISASSWVVAPSSPAVFHLPGACVGLIGHQQCGNSIALGLSQACLVGGPRFLLGACDLARTMATCSLCSA